MEAAYREKATWRPRIKRRLPGGRVEKGEERKEDEGAAGSLSLRQPPGLLLQKKLLKSSVFPKNILR